MPATDKARKVSRLKLRSDQLVEIHLDKMPEPPEPMMKLPGVAAWFGQMRLKEERDQQSLHRMLTQLNGNIAQAAAPQEIPPQVVNCTTQPGPPGPPSMVPGPPGEPGEGDVVLTWMNL